MPTVKLNRESLNKLIGKKLSDQDYQEKVTMLGAALEGLDSKEVTLEAFPNRPDLLSEQGLARALRTFLGIKKGLYVPKVVKSKEKVIVDASVKSVRPFTACAIVKNLKLDDQRIKELIQIQEKLHVTFGRNRKKCAIGIYPLEKITLPIKYAAKKPEEIKFKPLDGQKEMSAREILEKHPTGKEYGHLLKGLEKYPIFVDAKNKILSMPPLINSEETGRVTERTKEVFIECSGFDFKVVSQCLNVIVYALADMGAAIYSMEIDYEKKQTTPNLTPEEMKVDLPYINQRLGLNVKESELKPLFEKMGYGYKNKKVLIPAYRTDILHQIDLAEDIAIAYGYDNFKEEIPNVATIAEESKHQIFKRKLAQILIGLGLLEVNTYNLTNQETVSKKMNTDMKVIELASAVNLEYNILRPWVLPSLMQILSENKHHDYPQNLFGFGTIFKQGQTETGILEQTRVAIVFTSKDASFNSIKQVLETMFSALGEKYEIRAENHDSFIQGRTARVSFKGKDIAYLGEIHPQVLSNWNIEMPVAALELNVTELEELFSK